MRKFKYVGTEGQGLSHGQIITLNDENPNIERLENDPDFKELLTL